MSTKPKTIPIARPVLGEEEAAEGQSEEPEQAASEEQAAGAEGI